MLVHCRVTPHIKFAKGGGGVKLQRSYFSGEQNLAKKNWSFKKARVQETGIEKLLKPVTNIGKEFQTDHFKINDATLQGVQNYWGEPKINSKCRVQRSSGPIACG